jgi:hypothetical protein
VLVGVVLSLFLPDTSHQPEREVIASDDPAERKAKGGEQGEGDDEPEGEAAA